LLISCDCLSLYHPADISWRVGADGDWEAHTREALHFAPQGGILPSRYRVSCQICERPTPRDVHIHFELLGLETSKHFVLGIYDPSLAGASFLDEWRADPPSEEINAQRERVLENLQVWRNRAVARLIERLPPEVTSLKALNAHLEQCRDCRGRLKDWCPAYQAQSEADLTYAEGGATDSWLGSCGGCGLCEYDCPLGYPLFEVMVARKRRRQGAAA
jgi:NAD-dependent dihydropyrimidine dehydrogenase PreA subunit